MKYYHIITYGCQMNVADSERMAHQLEEVGYVETADVDQADLIIINTCITFWAFHIYILIYFVLAKVKENIEKTKQIILFLYLCAKFLVIV